MMPCPRRLETSMVYTPPESDHWCPEHNTCSYCGSMSPEEFMTKAAEGVELGPTDKNYKVYVNDDALKHRTAKFYFQHLSVDQRYMFLRLLQDKKLNIGFPGHFYVLPFFIERG